MALASRRRWWRVRLPAGPFFRKRRDTLSAANPWREGYDVSVVEALYQARDRPEEASRYVAEEPLVCRGTYQRGHIR